MTRGWHNEPQRHSLAARGVETKGWDIRKSFRRYGELSGEWEGEMWEGVEKMASAGTFKSTPDKDVWRQWKESVNMSPSELERFRDSPEGRGAGLSKAEAKREGIKSGQESAEWILKMKRRASSWEDTKENWTPKMWEWARRQNSFIARMRGVEGPLYDDKGRKTRKHLALLIWGHNPER